MRALLIALALGSSFAGHAKFDERAFDAAHARCDVAAMQALLEPAQESLAARRAAARLALTDNDAASAQQVLEAALEQHPQDAETHYLLALTLVRRIDEVSVFRKLGMARAALEAFRAAATLKPDSPEYLIAVAEYYRQAPGIAGGDLDLARHWQERVAAQAPQQARLLAARIDMDAGQPEVGREVISQLAREGLVDAQLALAQLAVESGDLETAIAQYRGILQRDPDHLLALYGLGRNSAVSGLVLAEGREAMQRFIALPGSLCQAEDLRRTHAYWRLGNILAKLGDADGARRAYQQALTLDPDNEPARDDLDAL